MGLPETLQSPEQIAYADVRRFMIEGDLAVRSSVLDFIRNNHHRIHPKPDDEWLRDELYRYYVDCISTDHVDEVYATEESNHSRFEAAHGLVDLFEWLVAGNAGGTVAAEKIARAITELFRRSDVNLRNCIETGFLEHVLEVPESRHFFDDWSRDSELAESHDAALAWGKAHMRRNASAKRR